MNAFFPSQKGWKSEQNRLRVILSEAHHPKKKMFRSVRASLYKCTKFIHMDNKFVP